MNEQNVKLPFAEDALQPVLSAGAVAQHFRGHHLAYVRKLADLVRGTPFEHHPLEEIIAETRASCEHCVVFNNAAQAWNHAFFWKSLGPADSGKEPSGRLLGQIEADYGNFESLKRHLNATAAKRFGSGWLWLVEFHGRLEALTTPNAETLVATLETRPILTVDLWEHAYYVDWRHRRAEYVEAVLDRLIDWSAASRRFSDYR